MRILITGATGLIGSRIVKLCLRNNLSVNYLTHSRNKLENKENYRGYFYDPTKKEIDIDCLEEVGAIINLAGENIFQPWTKKNRKRILNSRLNVADLLFKTLKENEHNVGQIVSASGISIYPNSKFKMYYEDEKEVNPSFLGRVVEQWEAAHDQFQNLGLRVAKIRTGIVLAKNGGALPVMQKPFKYNVGSAIGSGKQWQSWIHLDDLARIYLFSVQNGLEGAYNAVAPNPVTNCELMQEIGKTMGKKMWLPNVPKPLLKLALGKMASIALDSQLVSSKKIQDAGFSFYYTNLAKALEDINNL
ncbi:MAG TPA: TIGR01777 family oxidoreductase [Salinimicrobium sp.]|nr:TIGR01777 family oxidoreductase [Salinimicrobium sp.]